MSDVLVVGGTAAGVCAAVAAGRAGAPVTLVTDGRHLGGMTSGGLGYTDVGDVRALGGLAARFRQAVADHYRVPVGRYAGPEPHVAEAILVSWLEQAGVDVLLEKRVAQVRREGTQVTEVVLDDGTVARPAVVVDATYEGDVLALAGTTTRIGREARARHGERFAGRREIRPGRHSMPWGVDPFDGGSPIAQLSLRPLVEVGEGDGEVMSYGYRLCLTTAPDRVEITEPEGYDPAYWEVARRAIARLGDRPAGWFLGLEQNLPGGKCDANSLGPTSLSVLDGSARDWATADAAERERIRAHHERHARSFLWFLRQDEAVPRSVREEIGRWGFAADEFTDTAHVPHQLYVREARRLVGETVLTEHDLLAGAVPPDTVALGSYHLDIREVQRTWVTAWEHPDPEHHVVNEGYLSVAVPIYGIGYSCMLPRREELTNVLAAVCVSASHVAFSSIRMEPQYQMLGEAAGTAAALALTGGAALHDLDVAALHVRLREHGAVLSC
jgi:hypothetical protein